MDRSISDGVLSVAGAKVLTLFIGLLTTPILYRWLGAERIGIYYGLLAPFSLFMIFVSSGVSDGVRKFLAENRAFPDWTSHVVGFYFRLASGLALVGAGLVALVTWSGVLDSLLPPGYEIYGYLLAVLVVVSQFQSYARRTLMGFGLERYSEPLQIVQKVTFVGIALTLISAGYGVTGMFVGNIAASTAVALLGLALVNRKVSLRSVFRVPSSEFPRKELLTFNVQSIVLILCLTSLYQVDLMMLTLLTTSKQVGYYRGALELAEFLWFVPLALQTVFVHSTSELWAAGRTDKISTLAARTTRYTLLMTGVMAVGLAALAPDVVPVYLGSDFQPTVKPLLLLLPGALGFAVARPILAISQGEGTLGFPIRATGAAAAINIGLNAILIPRYGMSGAAVSTSIGYGSMFLFHVWSARKVGFDPLSNARLGRIAATMLLAAPPIFALAHFITYSITISGIALPLSLVIVPPLGLVIFLSCAFLTGALGICEVLRLLSDFPVPVGPLAHRLRCRTPFLSSLCG
ncbi:MULTISPECIES: polysaccharide biosynthesis C-terminal domain-containing protein [unclassified Haladaptatus]|uniref:oligosaccharide flippase family protein n=1 Tax=unclassified Haladaptatus TaxID=2622732 RepID=UPI00209BDAC9|nr:MULTISPECIES: polysaccharide biosynthesis C-terminal domain-containing protein [unclassified Haladaptatus]MCO8246060.1 polysaccharide biosynthesis C-terminal domain-containing protein [Haladaptatus sp. AB643]MCO8254320.1 polysaccharide biosynthesis C-terminal domain-containing protein [Haladaptatus sp. AB618]